MSESLFGHREHKPFKEVQGSRPPFEIQQFTFTQNYDTAWVPGQGANSMPDAVQQKKAIEEGKFVVIDPEVEPPGNIYRLMISAVIPRPIGFISTKDEAGCDNLAPMSYFNVCGHDPPVIMISVSSPGPDRKKDTCANILATKEFTVQIISEWFAEAANYTSINTPHNVSEWTLSGLTKAPSQRVRPSRVAESAFSMECVLLHHYEMISEKTGKVSGTVILGKVKLFHVRENIIKDGTILPDKLKPIARLGGIGYGRLTTGFDLERSTWEAESKKEEVQKLFEEKK